MKYRGNTIRINFIFIICIAFLFVIFFIKLCYVGLSDVVEGTDIKDLAESRITAKKTILASRGSIYDLNGYTLAQNVNSYTLIAYLAEERTIDDRYPKHVVDKETTAIELSKILLPLNDTMTVDYILSRLNSKNKYQVEFGVGGKNISELTKSQIDALALPGIDFERTSKRYYPYGDFASYIIGYAKKNGEDGELKGELGIEKYCDRFLRGTDGEIVYQKDRYGYQLANKVSYVTKEVNNGYDVYLTLDYQVQIFLDNAIDEIDKYDIDWSTIVVADAKTGAIIGSSSNPSYNPNNLSTLTNYNNPLTSFAYEPGSTMKIFSFMSAIEENKYDGSALYQSGKRTIDEYTISDWNKTGWGKISYDVGFTYSSNIAAANLAESLGRKTLASYYEKLGFGEITGIELANEYRGDMSFEYKTELVTASYGQGITVTPIQLIQALTTLTNDGTTLKPYIISKVVDTNTNEVVYEGKRTEKEKVYSTSTVNKMIELMDATVNSEDKAVTGKAYQTPAVRLIGKTGTSYYVDPETGKYAEGKYANIRSFAGVFPKENPEYIIYVAVKDFHGTSTNLGNIIQSLVESVAKYRNFDEKISNRDDSKIVTVPNLVNTSVLSSESKLNSLGLQIVKIGDGNTVINQYPKNNNVVSQNSKVYIITNGNNISMPNMTNWSSKEVNDFCDLAKITCNINGYGYVVSTSINQNDIINETSILEVNLEKKEPAKLTTVEEGIEDGKKEE